MRRIVLWSDSLKFTWFDFRYAPSGSPTRTACIAILLVAFWSVIPVAAADPVVFNRDIRPILSDKCFYCHGPDKHERQADLRLDTQEGLHGTAGRSGAIVPGKPEESELILRAVSQDPESQMPPPASGKSLSADEIAILKRWIAEGGAYEGHWSFLPRRVAPIESHADGREQDAEMSRRIDGFIDGTLVGQSFSSAEPADKTTLLRRLSFDLTGLPPSEKEVRDFLADESPHAYEQLVDRLLASPHYGERMAMWWLDLVRYADTVGYHGDQDMSVSPFREYVIRSFNENKPFDQFTTEQLAGDLMPDPTQEQLIASGYNRLGMMSAEGGVQDKEYLIKYMAERVRNASGTWLGITLGCAECHDHKFDPLSAKDFYRFGAFFADIKERGLYSGANSDGNWGPYVRVPTNEQATRRKSLREQLRAAQAALAETTPELLASLEAWETQQVNWVTLNPESMVSLEGVTLRQLEDGSILASGKNPANDSYVMTFRGLPSAITAFRLEVLPHESFPRQGPGRAGNGNFVLSEFVVHHRRDAGDTSPVALQNPSASYEQTGAAGANPYGKWAIAAAVDGDAKGRNWGWAVMEQVGKPHAAIFETTEDLQLGINDSLAIGLWQNLDNPEHTIGRFRLSVTTAPRPVQYASLHPPEIASILAIPSPARTDAQRAQLLAHYRTVAPQLEPQRQAVVALEKSLADLEAAMTSTLVTESVPPRMVRVLARGNWMDETGEVVEPGFPAYLDSQMGGREPEANGAERRLSRLDLAEWMVRKDHPLTARVLTNRLWKLLFGAGLSRKLDDLGAQGEWPSHPELLDALAQNMVDNDWDVRRWIKVVVMSNAYRRSSHASEAAKDRDPFNRFLSHQNRFRLDAELVRDNALSISGLLVQTLGGKSVRPYQPAGYWAYLNFPQREWQNGTGDELYRRGLYTHWQRQYLHPSLLVFDAPNREECTADRPRSNTPLQSLALLNDPTYVEAARAFAELLIRAVPDDRERLNLAFERALSRPISSEESEVLLPLLYSQLEEYRQRTDAARAFLSIGAKPASTDIDPSQLAAWTSVARVILNLHETITRY